MKAEDSKRPSVAATIMTLEEFNTQYNGPWEYVDEEAWVSQTERILKPPTLTEEEIQAIEQSIENGRR